MFLMCSASRICRFCLLFWCSNIVVFLVRIFCNSVVGHECFFKCCTVELVIRKVHCKSSQYIYIYIYISLKVAHVCKSIYMYIQTHTHMCRRVCVCVYIHIFIYSHTHTHTHTHTRTHSVPHDVIVKLLECSLYVNEFKLQSRYYNSLSDLFPCES